MKVLQRKKRLNAFSLAEVLVVLVIIGILVLMALPSLMPLISNARATEAKLQLGQLHMNQTTYFYANAKYADSFEDIGFEPPKLQADGGQAFYKIEIVEASPNSFKARATATVDFDRDGQFNVWEIDQDKNLKEITTD